MARPRRGVSGPRICNSSGCWRWFSRLVRITSKKTRPKCACELPDTLVWLDPSSPEFGILVSLAERAGSDPTGGEFSLKALPLFLSRLFLLQRSGRPGHDAIVTTVDQSGIRVLVNALNDPTGASSLYMRASALKVPAQGWDEGSPDPYTRRGLARRSTALGLLGFTIDSFTYRPS